jgi:orotidine-5'-phosphate decarboxylase
MAAESGGGSTGRPDERAGRAVAAHCRLVIDAVGAECVAVKLQLACFERLGGPGWEALRAAVAAARDRGLLVIADAKRGDIDISAGAYAQAFFGHTTTEYGEVEGLGADALTANPLLGLDSLEPLITSARSRGSGVFVLVRTTNPGAGDVQELELSRGGTVSDRLAELVAELGSSGMGSHGLADVGAVVGATAPERLRALRELMPHTIFLVPGVGAQGGSVDRLAAAFAPGPAGALISASRGIVDAWRSEGGEPGEAARRIAARLRQAAWALAQDGVAAG